MLKRINRSQPTQKRRIHTQNMYNSLPCESHIFGTKNESWAPKKQNLQVKVNKQQREREKKSHLDYANCPWVVCSCIRVHCVGVCWMSMLNFGNCVVAEDARKCIHIFDLCKYCRNKNKIFIIFYFPFNRYTVEYFSSDLQTGWVVAVHRYPGHMVTVSSSAGAAPGATTK